MRFTDFAIGWTPEGDIDNNLTFYYSIKVCWGTEYNGILMMYIVRSKLCFSLPSVVAINCVSTVLGSHTTNHANLIPPLSLGRLHKISPQHHLMSVMMSYDVTTRSHDSLSCTLLQSRNTSSPPLTLPLCLFSLLIFNVAADGASVVNSNQ